MTWLSDLLLTAWSLLLAAGTVMVAAIWIHMD